ncbi:MAG: glycosyltransferase family 2 protein [Acidobacteria bacterium]|nr:glycosyltransferase family 2 protein [Acidobacteriota bacterium]
MRLLWRIVKHLPLIVFSPFLVLIPALALITADLLHLFRRKKSAAWDTVPSLTAVSVVIPTWNGKHLLEKYLPSVLEALRHNPHNEIIVVDNRSSDGTAEYLLSRYPTVRVLEMRRNAGFGGGSNAGIRAARNDVVILLNNDMRVDPGFVQPLLDGFRDDKKVFAVSCQIFFSDPDRVREETGLTEGWWENGTLHVHHRADPAVTGLYPCFYGGGGSCAFDRRKFRELGGFDSIYSPFYLEDTDLGYMAWKRGWKVLYQPQSIVYHEHRGTIGRRYTQDYIEEVLKKNFILFAWKNIHDWRLLLPNFAYVGLASLVSVLLGEAPGRPNLYALLRAFRALPHAVRVRNRANSLALVPDTEAFRRPLGGYYRDRFTALPAQPEKPGVLFVSPYPVCPPTHGGGVFMYHTIRHLAARTRLHLIILVDHESEGPPHDELRPFCASVQLALRAAGHHSPAGSIKPHAIHEFHPPVGVPRPRPVRLRLQPTRLHALRA